MFLIGVMMQGAKVNEDQVPRPCSNAHTEKDQAIVGHGQEHEDIGHPNLNST